MNINLDEIIPHEIIKVLVDDDGIEDHMWAKVIKNEGLFLFVTYLVPTEKVYKDACVYSFEPKVNMVEVESICEHHQGIIDISDLGFTKININMFVMDDEVDDSCCDSEIMDTACEDDLEGFVVPDEPCADLPPGARQIDIEWDRWSPSTFGGQYFKSVVDRIEERARAAQDEALFLSANDTSGRQREAEHQGRV